MYKKSMTILIAIVVMSMILSACAPQVVKETVVVTQVVTEQVIVAGTPEIKEVVKTVIVEATPVPPEKKLEIFHWWTAPGEREAADAMFAAFKAKYADVNIVENPVPGGGEPTVTGGVGASCSSGCCALETDPAASSARPKRIQHHLHTCRVCICSTPPCRETGGTDGPS